MSTTFKIEHKGEIRRISIADDKITFSELSNTAKQLFERIPEKFAFKYTDDEGDEITVSSDKELIEAVRLLKALKTPTLKFKVTPLKEKRKAEEKKTDVNNNNNRSNPMFDLVDSIAQKFPFLEVSLETPDGRPVHRACPFQREEGEPRFYRAFCDNCKCKIPFPGGRFKCNACPDFDLCEKCHGIKGVHDATHKFVEIKHPRDILHNALCDSCGNFIVGDRYKCTACPDFDLCATCKTKPAVHTEGHNFEKLERPVRRCPRFTRACPTQTETPVKVSVPVQTNTEVKKEEVKEEKKEEVPVVIKEEPKEEPKKEEVKEEKKEQSAPVIDPFTAKLNQLNDMGFTNRERNINLLMKHKGDLVAVVKDLLF